MALARSRSIRRPRRRRWPMRDCCRPGRSRGRCSRRPARHAPSRAPPTRSATTGSPPSSLETACAPRSSALAACTWLPVTWPASLLPIVAGSESLVGQQLRYGGGQAVDVGVVDHVDLGLARRISQSARSCLRPGRAAGYRPKSCTWLGSTRTTLCMPSSLQPSSSRTGMVANATLPPRASAAAG